MENFVQFKILSYLENFAGSNSTFHVYTSTCIIFEKRENQEIFYPYGSRIYYGVG